MSSLKNHQGEPSEMTSFESISTSLYAGTQVWSLSQQRYQHVIRSAVHRILIVVFATHEMGL